MKGPKPFHTFLGFVDSLSGGKPLLRAPRAVSPSIHFSEAIALTKYLSSLDEMGKSMYTMGELNTLSRAAEGLAQ